MRKAALRHWTAEGIYLAIESSGPVASVALARGGEVLSRGFLAQSSEQASHLVPVIVEVMQTAGVSRRELDGVVLGSGPGSFTGLRVGGACAKGLAHALALPLWAFSSLAAGALSDLVLPWGAGVEGWWDDPTAAGSDHRYVLFDARGERVYGACYDVVDRSVRERIPGHATTVTELLETPGLEGVAFVGDAAVRHRHRFSAAGRVVLGAPAGIPTADALIALLAVGPEHPPVANVPRWEPEYLKASSAERERLNRSRG
jgi:tRNA threonylcarbamoyladenosine biosynthesis protein TsaB